MKMRREAGTQGSVVRGQQVGSLESSISIVSRRAPCIGAAGFCPTQRYGCGSMV